MNNSKLILSLSCLVAFTLAPLATASPRGRGGGAGAGFRPGAGAIRTGTDTMVMATRMATATVPRTATAMEAPNTVTTGTVMDMAIMEMDTAIPAGPEWLSYSAGSLAPAITTGPSMEFWVPELAGLFAHTRLTTATRAEQG